MTPIWWLVYGYAVMNGIGLVVLSLVPHVRVSAADAKYLRYLHWTIGTCGVITAMLGYPWGGFPGLIRLLDVDPLLYFTAVGAFMTTMAPIIALRQRAGRGNGETTR